MLEVNNRIIVVIKKCFSTEMLQDFYNCNRSWCYTNYGRFRQNNDNGKRNGNGSGESSRSSSNSNSNRQFEFSIMTYNCLAQDAISRHSDMYINCPHGSLDWPSRRENLARELKESKPDIICLQEVNSSHHEAFYKPFLRSLNYSGLYKKRTGSLLDGCALYFKISKFKLLDKIELEFFRLDLTKLLDRENVAIVGVLKPLKSSHRSHNKSGSNPFESNRIVIATTHLLYNPSRGDVKLAQLRLLLAELDQLVNSINSTTERCKTNVILCGDMNTVPYSPLYNFITTGFLDTTGFLSGDLSGQADGFGRGKICRPSDLIIEGINSSSQYEPQSDESQTSASKESERYNWRHNGKNTTTTSNQVNPSSDQEKLSLLANYSNADFLKARYSVENEKITHQHQETSKIRHNFTFSSVYPIVDVNNSPFITTHHSMGSCMVDYIFYNRSDNMELLGYTRLLNRSQMDRIGYLPNQFLGSDHLSLQAKFLLKN